MAKVTQKTYATEGDKDASGETHNSEFPKFAEMTKTVYCVCVEYIRIYIARTYIHICVYVCIVELQLIKRNVTSESEKCTFLIM